MPTSVFQAYWSGLTRIHTAMYNMIAEAQTLVYLTCFEFEPSYTPRKGPNVMHALEAAVNGGWTYFSRPPG